MPALADAPRVLSRDAWLEAGQDILRNKGIRALKLRPLAEHLGISTGSFYHHFKDFDDFLGALAGYYCGAQFEANLRQIRSASPDPRARLKEMTAMVARERLQELASAMRAWAQSDPRADAAVKRLDSAILRFVVECLTALGFNEADAHLRAYLLLSLSAANVPVPAKAGPKAALPARILDIICG